MDKQLLIGHYVCSVQSAVELGWVQSQGDEYCTFHYYHLDTCAI